MDCLRKIVDGLIKVNEQKGQMKRFLFGNLVVLAAVMLFISGCSDDEGDSQSQNADPDQSEEQSGEGSSSGGDQNQKGDPDSNEDKSADPDEPVSNKMATLPVVNLASRMKSRPMAGEKTAILAVKDQILQQRML